MVSIEVTQHRKRILREEMESSWNDNQVGFAQIQIPKDDMTSIKVQFDVNIWLALTNFLTINIDIFAVAIFLAEIFCVKGQHL